MSKILWIDCETCGLDPKRNGLLQVSGIVEVDGKEVEEFDFRIKPFPTDEIEDSALAVNGITREQLAGFMDPQDAHKDMEQIFERHVSRYDKQDKFVFAGYNAQFDINFLCAFFKKCGDPYFFSWVWWPPLDVSVLAMQQLMGVRHTFKNFKLATLAEHWNIAADSAHDAFADIRMTKEVYDRLYCAQEPQIICPDAYEECDCDNRPCTSCPRSKAVIYVRKP